MKMQKNTIVSVPSINPEGICTVVTSFERSFFIFNPSKMAESMKSEAELTKKIPSIKAKAM